jgi:hypothetical protein
VVANKEEQESGEIIASPVGDKNSEASPKSG